MTSTDMIARAAERVAGIAAIRAEAFFHADMAQFVDVREEDERTDHGFIAGSIHVPRGLLEFAADPDSASYRAELDLTRPTIVYDAAGKRAVLAAQTLQELGYVDVTFLEGGLMAWARLNLPVAGRHAWHVPARS